MPSVVVFELNEVPWRVLDWWVAARPSSAIADLLRDSDQRTTVTPDRGPLSPWVTWPTLHRGVSVDVHGIRHLGQDPSAADRVAPPWWRTAADAGRRVGLFGLLHTSALPADVERYAFWVPDTFSRSSRTHPRSIEAFQAFNLSMARASARNVDPRIDLRSAIRFLVRSPTLGLRPATFARLAEQLVEERRRPESRVRRRSFQSAIAFDLFAGQLRRTRPDAAAFFTNHVASAMHRYWAATFPEDYPADEFGFDAAWVDRWDDELGVAMAHADRMVARLRRHCIDIAATLVVASSMGQQAAQGTPVSRQLYLRDLDRFVADAGIEPTAVVRQPAMDPHVNVVVDAGALDRLRDRLAAVTVGGRRLEWHEEPGGFVSMAFGQADAAIGEVTVDGRVRDPETLGFEVVTVEDAVASSGYHVPEGVLVVHPPTADGRPDRSRAELPSTAVAPFLLRTLGVPPAPHHGHDGVLADVT